jgi:protein-disulfide isomerase
VTVAVFSDFQCPFSARVETTLRALEREYAGRVRVAFRNQPLPMHDQARLAAKAAIAADEQGKFWEYHDALFAHQGAQDRPSLDRYAATVGLDVRRFDRVLDSPETEARVAADEAQATRLGVTGTPTTFVNGRRVVGAQPIATFRAAVERALAESAQK